MGADDEDAALAHQQELERQELEELELFRCDVRAWLRRFEPLTQQLKGLTATRDSGLKTEI